MFKLSLQEGFLDFKRTMREQKWMLVLWVLVVGVISLSTWADGEDGSYHELFFWSCYFLILGTGITQYGRGRIFPVIFSYVPMGVREKKRYMMYRTFQGAVIAWLLFLAMSFGFAAVEKLSDSYLLLCILSFSEIATVKAWENFWSMYKAVTGAVVYPGITRGKKLLFWTMRVLGFGVSLIAIFVLVGEKTAELSRISRGIQIWEGISIICILLLSLHNAFFIRTALRQIDVADRS